MKNIPPFMWFGMVVFGIGALTGYTQHALFAIGIVGLIEWFKNLLTLG